MPLRASSTSSLPNVATVTQGSFARAVVSRPLFILKVGFGGASVFSDDLLRYFDAEYRGGIAFGYLDRIGVGAYPTWSMKHLGGIWESATRPLEAPVGYYLFVGGGAVAFHGGTIGQQDDLAVLGLGLLFSAIGGSARPIDVSIGVVSRRSAEAVIGFFESQIVHARTDAQPPIEVPSRSDPYELLGVAPTASDAEVARARSAKVRLNHPDKVAQMSAEIRRFANDQTRAINDAYAAIVAQRGAAKRRSRR